MIKLAIVGYGNLGKSLERQILANKRKYELVGIFSRRRVESPFGTKVFAIQTIEDFIEQIDTLLLCGGSEKDLLTHTPELSKYFSVIDCFDTHTKIRPQRTLVNGICKESHHHALISCGWDPGLFSLVRVIANALKIPYTTEWGKGVSMGHSQAIRTISGVQSAISYTYPPARRGGLHRRELFVVAPCGEHTRIEREIRAKKDYFEGDNVKIHFISQAEFDRDHQTLMHQGRVYSHSKEMELEFKVKMDSNPDFTGRIVLAYVNALEMAKKYLPYGAYTVLDLPIGWLCDKSEYLI